MTEPTIADVLAAVQKIEAKVDGFRAETDRRFDDMNARIETVDRKVDTVHGVVRQVQREVRALRGTVQMLLDAHALFRSEYLREHPGGGHQ